MHTTRESLITISNIFHWWGSCRNSGIPPLEGSLGSSFFPTNPHNPIVPMRRQWSTHKSTQTTAKLLLHPQKMQYVHKWYLKSVHIFKKNEVTAVEVVAITDEGLRIEIAGGAILNQLELRLSHGSRPRLVLRMKYIFLETTGHPIRASLFHLRRGHPRQSSPQMPWQYTV